MNNWQILSHKQSSLAWEYIYEQMQFNPRGEEKLIDIPEPSRCYDISSYYDAGFREDYYNDLHEKIRQVFCIVTHKGERVIALNWQHDGYSFDPRLEFEKDEFGEWLVPVFPNGDYIFFLTADFSNGIFCDGINLSICLFGDKMLQSTEVNLPVIFIGK